MAATPLEVQQRGVDLGVALVLQTADDRVLLTRRAKDLRVFPNVWVPPGLMSRAWKGRCEALRLRLPLTMLSSL